jgi:23S rRNA (pseudouridine1915-N3)-methyltransferase
VYRIKIIAVGRLNEPFWRTAQTEYLKRLMPYAKVSVAEVPERRADTPGGIAAALAAEAKDVRAAIPPRFTVAALCIKGQRMDSLSFSRALESAGVNGGGNLCFVIGGSNGLNVDIENNADMKLSMSDMTMPHALAQVFLLEQLYRAFTIIQGGQYHK